MTTVEGATVTITGGTGSFGSKMVSHLLTRSVNSVHILSRDEAKQDEMRRHFSDARLKFFLGDVRDYDSVAGAFVDTDFVFHAAALKQVPSCEFFPQQAVKTNVVGSHNVIQAAAAAGVRSVVCLSTDKAVYPVNVMGMVVPRDPGQPLHVSSIVLSRGQNQAQLRTMPPLRRHDADSLR